MRGLKLTHIYLHVKWFLKVAPYLGAWIEIFQIINIIFNILVAPYLGAWIEIDEDFEGG